MEIELTFGDYLKRLIKDAGLSQIAFYQQLGIKKPYFYDILSGRTNPPPYELQIKAMDILQASPETKIQFYDLAAKGRGDMPADIYKWVSEDPTALRNIRKVMNT